MSYGKGAYSRGRYGVPYFIEIAGQAAVSASSVASFFRVRELLGSSDISSSTAAAYQRIREILETVDVTSTVHGSFQRVRLIGDAISTNTFVPIAAIQNAGFMRATATVACLAAARITTVKPVFADLQAKLSMSGYIRGLWETIDTPVSPWYSSPQEGGAWVPVTFDITPWTPDAPAGAAQEPLDEG